MTKYREELKERLSRKCLLRKGGYWSIGKKAGVDVGLLRYWAERYRIHGPGCFKRERGAVRLEQRAMIVEHMRDKKLSKREAGALFNLPSFSMIGKWERESEKSEQEPAKKVEGPVDLAEENRKLRMENEYLKKLWALVRGRGAERKRK
jgi:transposase